MKTLQAIFHILIFSSLVTHGAVSIAQGEERLNDFDRMRRLSFVLRGRALTFSEVASLRQLQGQERLQLMNQMSSDFIASEDFNLVMTNFLADLFRVARPTFKTSDNGVPFSTLHSRFYHLIKNNQSWDNLLTSTQITSTMTDFRTNRGLPSFYKDVVSADEMKVLKQYVEESYIQTLAARFPGDGGKVDIPAVSRFTDTSSPFLAGTLTDPAFLDRFPTTAINQNRKRAAAVFRIFLCDDMKAVILPDSNAERELELAALDDGAAARAAITSTPNIVKLHASDEKCSSCHYKLDPVATAFRGTSTRVNNNPVAGKLTYKRKSGELVQIPYKNMQELAQALVRQPEYAACQVRHFWNLVVGQDVPLNTKTERELVDKFNKSGRRPKDFIQFLTSRPEVSRFPKFTVETIDFQQVSGILANCKSCHDKEPLAPALDRLPFSKFGAPNEHAEIVEDLITQLDLLGNGSAAKMPTKNAGWKLESGERALLSAWLAGGAKTANDDDNSPSQATWSNPVRQGQLAQKLTSEGSDLSLKPSFDYTAKRHASLEQLAATYQAMAKELGVNMNNYLPEFKLRNLETGQVLSNPTASYGSAAANLADQFQAYFAEKFIQKLVSIDKAAMERQVNAFVITREDQMTGAKAFGQCVMTAHRGDHAANMRLILEIHTVIYGYAPEASSVEYAKLENYVRRFMAKTQLGLEYNARPFARQLMIQSKFLSY